MAAMLTTSEINSIIDTVIKHSIKTAHPDLKNLRLQILQQIPNVYETSGNLPEVQRVLDIMQNEQLIKILSSDDYLFTEKAKQIFEQGGWLKSLQSHSAEMELEREIKRLSKDQLELSIREMHVNFTQIRYWWLALIIIPIASAILGAWLQSLFK